MSERLADMVMRKLEAKVLGSTGALTTTQQLALGMTLSQPPPQAQHHHAFSAAIQPTTPNSEHEAAVSSLALYAIQVTCLSIPSHTCSVPNRLIAEPRAHERDRILGGLRFLSLNILFGHVEQ